MAKRRSRNGPSASRLHKADPVLGAERHRDALIVGRSYRDHRLREALAGIVAHTRVRWDSQTAIQYQSIGVLPGHGEQRP